MVAVNVVAIDLIVGRLLTESPVTPGEAPVA
jgi:hypothetical protein